MKLLLYATVYAGIVYFILFSILKLSHNKLYQRAKRLGCFIFPSLCLIFFILFVQYKTAIAYWDADGFGDSSRIPIGHGKEISAIDSTPMIETPNSDGLIILEAFAYTDTILVAKMQGHNNASSYLVWHLIDDTFRYFLSQSEYDGYAQSKQLPTSAYFEDYHTHFQRYWWAYWARKSWLLP